MDENRQAQTPSSIGITAEIREAVYIRGQRRKLFPRAMLVGLPAGCVLVTIHRDRYEVVPTPNTLLEVGNRLTAVIAPQAIEALAMLREGCEAPQARG